MDWNRLGGMLSAHGWDNLASEAIATGERLDAERRFENAQDKALQNQVQHLLRRAKAAQEEFKASPQPPAATPGDKAGPIRWGNLPEGAREFVGTVIRQGEPGALYTLDDCASSGVEFNCTAAFFDDDGPRIPERYLILLIESQGAEAKASIRFRLRGSSWVRLPEST